MSIPVGKREEDARSQPALPGKVLFQNQTKPKGRSRNIQAQVTDRQVDVTLRPKPELHSHQAHALFQSHGPQPCCISEVGSKVKTMNRVRHSERFLAIVGFVVVVVF